MKVSTQREITALEALTVSALRVRYAEVFGEETRTHHRDNLRRKIAWRIQANAEGGLSERAKRRAAELANEADLRRTEPKAPAQRTHANVEGEGDAQARQHISPSSDRRLPMPGTILTKEYKGQLFTVTVREKGFELNGTEYRSLSAIAKEITGAHWNGYGFFGLLNNKNREVAV